MTPIHSYKDYMKARYGEPLFRVPVDTGRGCPHREPGGGGGCTFCTEFGARAVQTRSAGGMDEQIRAAIDFARKRYRAHRFMLYLQAFSATRNLDEAAKEEIRRMVDVAAFDAVAIGTRPDCLNADVMQFLCELNAEREVWVELGIQTVHDATLKRINRGHDWACSKDALQRLADAGICTVAHVIIGLPGEGSAQFNETAEQLAALPITAVKLHNLHVIRGSRMAEEFLEEAFPVYDTYDYAEFLMQFLRRTPWERPIVRMTTDTPEDELVIPHWHRSKGQFLDYIQQQMVCREWRQGDLVKNAAAVEPPADAGRPVVTEDGSITLWNETYREHYHTPVGARMEAEEKYVIPVALRERLQQGDVRLLDICFGMGYNALSACERASDMGAGMLEVDALEMDRRVVGQASRVVQSPRNAHFSWADALRQLYEDGSCQGAHFRLNMSWGDARYRIQALEKGQYDVVFLDAFSTQRNSELWTQDFFELIHERMKPDGVLVTYCAALPVRSGLLKAGFFVGQTRPVARSRGGTLASVRENQIHIAVDAEELNAIRNTPRGLPYRDPYLCWTNREILRTRQDLVVRLRSGGE